MPIRAAALVALLAAAGCSGSARPAPSRPRVDATGPIISATPKPSGSPGSTAPGGAEGARSEAAETPCPLVSAQAVTAAFGARIAAQTTGTSGPNAQFCQIRLANSNLGPGISLRLTRLSPASAASFAAGRRAALAHGAVAVAGVGQSAYYTPSAHNLQYLSGTTTGALQVQSSTPGTLAAVGGRVQANLVALARSAVGNQ